MCSPLDLVTPQAGRAFVLKLTGQRISACNCTYQLRGSDTTGLSCKHADCWPITARHSRKLGDFLVEKRTCSTWTIKSDDFGGRQNRPIFE